MSESWKVCHKRLVSKVCIAAATLLALSGCGGSFKGTFEFDGEEFNFSFDFPDIASDRHTDNVPFAGLTTLRVTSKNGPVRVTVDSAEADAVVRSFRFANGKSTDEANKLLEQVIVNVATTGANNEILEVTVSLPTQDPDGNELNPGRTGVSLHIRLPAGLALDLNLDSAPLTVSNNTGAVRVRSINAGIHILDSDGDQDLETDNGSIEATEIHGNVLARAQNGRLTVRATPASDGSLDAETKNGSVIIRVPTSIAASLDMETTNGSVETDFAGFANVNNLSSTGKKLTATINGGGATVRGKTTNGNVSFEAM